jgi:hypothetical protein
MNLIYLSYAICYHISASVIDHPWLSFPLYHSDLFMMLEEASWRPLIPRQVQSVVGQIAEAIDCETTTSANE